MNIYGLVKFLYYIAFVVVLIGFVMEAWDIKHNVPFSFWLTGALALVTLLKVPYKIWQGDMLPIMELLISLVAYIYLTYLKMHKSTELKLGKIMLSR